MHATPVIPLTLSPRGKRFLEITRARRVPSLTCDREALLALLRARRLPAYEPVLVLEEQLGGFEAGWLQLGAYRMLSRKDEHDAWAERLDDSGQPLVLVGRDADNMLYMDGSGAIFEEPLGSRGTTRRAESAARWLERAALLHEMIDAARFPVRCELSGRLGHAVAATLDVRLDRDASDSVQSFWSDEHVVLGEGRIFQRPEDPRAERTMVFAASTAFAARALRAAAAVGPSARARVNTEPTELLVLPPENIATPDANGKAPIQLVYLARSPREHGFLLVQGGAEEASIDQVLLSGERLVEISRYTGRAGIRRSFTAATSTLVGAVSERAIELMKGARGRLDPREKASPEEARALLDRHGLPVYDAVLRFEEQFGGLEFTRDENYVFGILSQLEYAPRQSPLAIKGRVLAPVGSHGDFTYYMDEGGLIYEKHWEEAPTLVADSLPDLLDDMAR